MCKILERIKEYIDHKGIPIALFEKTIGMSNGAFGKQLKKKGAIGTDKLENILFCYPDLSPEWLLSGTGAMLKIGIYDSCNESHSDFHPNSVELSPKLLTRPRIPYDASAGALSFVVNGITSSQCEQIPLIQSFPHYDFTIFARGDSMYPDLVSGDELACAFVYENRFIQWGRTHVLDTAQGVVVKRIFNHNNSILCRSINHDYPDFEIPKDEVYHIALVVGLIRHL